MHGLTLSPSLDESTIRAVEDALEEYLVLFFKEQHLTPTEQRDLAARFGELYVHPFYPGCDDAPEIMILEHDAKRKAKSDRWHTDVTYLAAPARAAILYSECIPDTGGDTLWASMYRAYDELSTPIKKLMGNLRAVHSFSKNFTPERFLELNMEDRRDQTYADNPDVSHPVVRTNPLNGRKALFVNQDFTLHIEGVSSRESNALLRLLYEHMAQPEFQIRWRWQPNTVAFWDNRWTQHCALADYYPLRRRVRRATISGDRPI